MLVGVPKEIKTHEYRVGLTPSSVRELVHHGHRVMVEHDAGDGIGCDDAMYRAAGAEVVADPAEVYAEVELLVKVKEPQPNECEMLREGQVLFTYLHLAADPEQTRMLCDSGCIAIAYETVTNGAGGLPLLAPMRDLAFDRAVLAGSRVVGGLAGVNGAAHRDLRSRLRSGLMTKHHVASFGK